MVTLELLSDLGRPDKAAVQPRLRPGEFGQQILVAAGRVGARRGQRAGRRAVHGAIDEPRPPL